MGLGPLRGRPYFTLSGGERRLALVARGLAQEARYLLLDEPDAHLDPANQHHVLAAVQERLRVAWGLSSAPTTRTAPSCTGIGLPSWRGGRLAVGSPPDVLTEDLLERAYGIPFVAIGDGNGPPGGPPPPRGSPGQELHQFRDRKGKRLGE